MMTIKIMLLVLCAVNLAGAAWAVWSYGNIEIEGYDDDGFYVGPECREDEYRQEKYERERAKEEVGS